MLNIIQTIYNTKIKVKHILKEVSSYSGALVWNSIPSEIKNADTLSSFVSNCLKLLKGEMLL